ncbi:low temperature requirement A [Nitrobacter hamburgensis X14]|uniref:Low temperature requirement A n=1 Tax=Nitrobacter hamburgensis (strain DSM 10229 / NCIMB 13809 / X14) TaxID=323097 RepID=Q1QMU0_NITHX|nr:low temperature requirement protein A [Nitrobacter hamburgensis]ABE62457.1 low temperature requirement A [Nitrobacter hamburgensis X14]
MTYVELFFDLVFVFAITQISHSLLAHFTPLGVLQVTMLMLAVWWVWVFTSWITNWLDPEQAPVRVMLFGLMIAGLLLSTSIPKAFESRGLTFAAAYSVMQVGRTLFFLWSVPTSAVGQRNNVIRILFWLGTGAVFWIGGGLAEGNIRIGLWLVALAIEYAGPAMRFRTPRLGASTTRDWDVEGGHMAERCALFIIIALGESIVVTGATFAETAWTATTVCAFLVALLGSIAMWWVYFHIGAEAGSEHISQSADTGRLARLAYTYLHLPVVAGIIVSAVGDELLLAHPGGHVGGREILSIVGGPLLYLIGTILFKHAIRGIFQLSHLVGIGLLIALIPLASGLTLLSLAAVVAAILMMVAAWEAISLGSGSRQPQNDG